MLRQSAPNAQVNVSWWDQDEEPVARVPLFGHYDHSVRVIWLQDAFAINDSEA